MRMALRKDKGASSVRGRASRERDAQSSAELAGDLDVLRSTLEVGDGALPGDAVVQARSVLQRADERLSLRTGRTVVAILGATGSGKSSLTNALAGRPVATVAARRPTTSEPLAVVWGDDDAGPVLDWLQIPQRVLVNRPRELPVGPGGESLASLVVVDMPDIDSTETRHRETTERLAQSVDVLLWVLDPQKYADASIHHEFLRPMADHAQVTLVALNQVDTLDAAERERILSHLRVILDGEGLKEAQIFPVSARTEEGIPALFARLAEVASSTQTMHERLRADVRTAGRALAEGAGLGADGTTIDGAPLGEITTTIPQDAVDRLVDASAAAAGEEAVTGAVERSYRRHAFRHVGWVPLRWISGFRSDPMKNLHLDGKGLDPDLVRSSLPAATPVQEAGVRSAAQSLVLRAADGLPDRWGASVVEGMTARIPGAVADLDGAIVGTDTENGVRPRWWKLVGFLHWVAFAALLGGLLWLLGIAVGSYLQFEIATPLLGAFPWPVVLVAGGALLGLLLWFLGSAAARVGARRRAARVRRRIRSQVEGSVRETLVAPVERELETYATLQRLLQRLVRN